MAVTFNIPVDELDVAQLIADGFTSLTLWYADEPDGVYQDSGVTPDPATLAAAVTAEDYEFEFSYSGGSPSQWFKVRAKQGISYSDIYLSSPFTGGSGVTLAYLRRRLGKMLGDMAVITTTASADANTATCTGFEVKRWPDNYFNGQFIYRPATDEDAIIDSSTQSTGALNFSPDNGTTVGSGVVLEITKRWTHSEYNEAINWACVAAYPVLSRPIVNTGLLTIADTMVYTAPQDILTITSVEIESKFQPDSTDPAVRGRPWSQVPFAPLNEGLNVKFELNWPEMEDQRLRVCGTGYLSQMAEDTDSTECLQHNADLLLAKAAERLFSLMSMNAASSDRDFYIEQESRFKSLYLESKPSQRSKRSAQRRWGADARAQGGGRAPYDPRRDGRAP
ncbi:MAG: hypothetical protein WC869_13515 [Phycisphaerae bacterium]|jgi:hypothetical protein